MLINYSIKLKKMPKIINLINKYKTLLLVIVFVLFSLFLAFLIYLLFFKTSLPTQAPPTVISTSTTAKNGLPLAKTGKGNIVQEITNKGQLASSSDIFKKTKPSETAKGDLTKVTELNKNPSLGAVLSPNGKEIQYYDKKLGKFYRLDSNGNQIPLTDKVFYNVKNITWAPQKNKAILEYPDGANIIYDFEKDKQVTLPKHWQDFNFSPQGNKIIAKSIGLDVENRWLLVADSDGSNAKALKPMGANTENVITKWSPNNQIVAMFSEGIDYTRKEVYFIGLHDENFKSIIVEGRGFMPLWSPRGDYLLYSVYSPQTKMKPSLWVVNAQGENIGSGRRSLGILTWANKCVFSSNTELYCAVPESLEEGAGLFLSLAKSTKDYLLKINTQTGLKKIIAIPAGTYNMTDLLISQDKTRLYFTDATSGKINSIRLK